MQRNCYEETEFKAEPLSDDEVEDLEDFLWQPDGHESDSGPQNGAGNSSKMPNAKANKHTKVKHHPLIPKKKPFELRTTNQALSQDELAKFEEFDPPGWHFMIKNLKNLYKDPQSLRYP